GNAATLRPPTEPCKKCLLSRSKRRPIRLGSLPGRGAACLLHCLRVAHDRLTDDLQVVCWAELEVLGTGLRADRDVSGGEVEGIASLEDLLVVAAVEPQATLKHVAPMGGRASVVGQPLHERSRIEILLRCQELNRCALQVLTGFGDGAVVVDLRRAFARDL